MRRHNDESVISIRDVVVVDAVRVGRSDGGAVQAMQATGRLRTLSEKSKELDTILGKI